MEEPIRISNLNDFGFCPVSIYFHNLMGDKEKIMTQTSYQINGTNSHSTVDQGTYSSKKCVLQSIEVYCDKYGICGKIDIFDISTGVLTERKKKISKLFDGQIFQLYGQYFSLVEMGYNVNKLRVYSMDDNRNYYVPLPGDDSDMLMKFEKLIIDIRSFNPRNFVQSNSSKCDKCIYEVMCSSSVSGARS